MSETQIQTSIPRFTTKTYDKFKERTDIRWKDPMGGRLLGVKWAPTFWVLMNGDGSKVFTDKLSMNMRYSKFPGAEAIIIDYDYRGIDWKFIRDGNITINLDDVENIVLDPYESDTETVNDEVNAVHVVEIGYWSLTKEQLKKICDAKKIDVRVTGSAQYMDVKGTGNLLKFQFMCRSFYAEVFNDHSYDAWINTVIPAGSEELKDKAWYLVVGYLCFWFLFPVTFGIGAYLLLARKKFSDGQKKPAFSATYRINGAIMMIVALAVFIYVWQAVASVHAANP